MSFTRSQQAHFMCGQDFQEDKHLEPWPVIVFLTCNWLWFVEEVQKTALVKIKRRAWRFSPILQWLIKFALICVIVRLQTSGATD